MLRGIDVSRYQGAIAWLTVAPQIDFAYIKAGGGDDTAPYADPLGAPNALGAKRAGVPFGFYWFFSGRNSVASQKTAIAAMVRANRGESLPWAIDIEDATRPASEVTDGLALADAVAQLTGVKPLIYTGAWFWDIRYQALGGAPEIPYGLWVAAYADAPLIPHGWDDYTVWQHSDRGHIDGITGAVDLNQARAPFWVGAPGGDVPKFRITATALNLRAEPNAASTRLADPPLPNGAIVEADAPVAGWHRVKLANGQQTAGGVTFSPPEPYRVPTFGYISAAWTEPVLDPPPPVSTGFRTGVNAKTNFHLTRQAFQDGCRYGMIIDEFSFAADLARDYPGATVMARRWLSNGSNVTTVKQALDALEGANYGQLVYTLWNEGDAGRSIKEQAKLEIDLAREIKRISGARFAAGTFAMGTMDFTNPAICAQIRDAYSGAYNAGVIGFDMHLYSPNMLHIWQDAELIWYERRWEFLFTKCGFDPRVRAIYCGETGVDQGGVGGFPAHGASGADVARWVRRNAEVQQRPIVVDGVSYPSPAIGGALFQLGDDNSGPGGWAGYNIAYALPELRPIWTGGG